MYKKKNCTHTHPARPPTNMSPDRGVCVYIFLFFCTFLYFFVLFYIFYSICYIFYSIFNVFLYFLGYDLTFFGFF